MSEPSQSKLRRGELVSTSSRRANVSETWVEDDSSHAKSGLPSDFRFNRQQPWEPDSHSSKAVIEFLDRSTNAAMGRYTGGLSPSALATAYLDWLLHLSASPGKKLQLNQKALKKIARFQDYMRRSFWKPDTSERCIDPLPQDDRFDHALWNTWPFNYISQSFLLTQQWWHNATSDIPGVMPEHERIVEFCARQALDILSPSNFVLTNPEVLQKTILEGGMNLVRGWQNFTEDLDRLASGKGPVDSEEFIVGDDVATTPGHVIYRNCLMELIQYSPSTEKVRAEPILIVPAWIMKYYVLDLSPENSLVRYLVDEGYTVFMISWKNPGPEDRELGFDDYRRLGVLSAVDVIQKIAPNRGIHGVGYCLGGTLLGVTAASLATNTEDPFASLSFFASQFDFTEAGELMLFITESQVSFLEDVMWEQGFLDTSQMTGAFQMIRSNDLIWSRIEHDYLMGERRPMNDMMAWNADTTRMPYRMHSEYLRHFFLNNDLAEGRYRVDGRVVSISNIRLPIFSLATTKDHVAPWRSVFKVHMLADTEVTFLLTSGGHNAGVVSEPGHEGRSFRISTAKQDDYLIGADLWITEAKEREGSWWPEWSNWLSQRSTERVDPPGTKWVNQDGTVASDGEVCRFPAPGTYVLMN